MKTLIIALLIGAFLSVHAQKITKKTDFIKKNESGEVQMRGVYTTDDSGYVIRYDLFDGKGELTKTSIPYYSRDGRLLESRDYDGDGRLLMVAVFIDDKIIALDRDGKRIEKYSHEGVEIDGFLKHFRDNK